MTLTPYPSGAWACIVLLCLLARGCATQIIPPQHPQMPVTVYVTDYGRHSTIIMPARGGGYDEYAFGDWDFLALGRTDITVAIRALLDSPESTLGWRHIGPAKNQADLKEMLGAKRLMPVVVSRPRLNALAIQIAARFRRSRYVPIYSDYSLMSHVPDQEHYWGLNNCNHITARWLKQLGCDIHGTAITSKFYVSDKRAQRGAQAPMTKSQ